MLSIGLVLVTTFTVAVVAHAVIDGLSWPAAVVLGAIVSPTDPVAASAVARRLQLPRRIVAIVEGESLINGGTALIAYRFAARTGEAERAESGGYEEHSAAYQRLRAEVLGAERAALLRLRSEGRIGDEVMPRVERDLDLEESRLEIPARPA